MAKESRMIFCVKKSIKIIPFLLLLSCNEETIEEVGRKCAAGDGPKCVSLIEKVDKECISGDCGKCRAVSLAANTAANYYSWGDESQAKIADHLFELSCRRGNPRSCVSAARRATHGKDGNEPKEFLRQTIDLTINRSTSVEGVRSADDICGNEYERKRSGL